MSGLDLIDRARGDATRIAEHLLGAPNRKLSTQTAIRWRAKGSFLVNVSKGTWRDFETGEFGDALDLVEREKLCSRKDAIKWLADWFGERVDTPAERQKQKDEIKQAVKADEAARAGKTDAAAAMWRSSSPLIGSLGEAYLRSRLNGEPVSADAIRAGNVRWHGQPYYGGERIDGAIGAVVSRMIDPTTGEGRGVHRIFVGANAAKIEKRMLGSAGVVALYPYEDIDAGLGLGEGLESSLAVQSRFEWRGVWSTLSAGTMRTFPLLSGVDALTVFADADASETGQKAALEVAQRYADAGREAQIYEPPIIGSDFADFGGLAA